MVAAIGLAEAARLSGRNRSTIHRVMQTGRLSYTKTADGERRIDIAELDRVFGIKFAQANLNAHNTRYAGNSAQPAKSRSAQPGEIAALLVIETLRATAAEQHATIRLIQDEKRTLMALLIEWRRWLR